MQFITETIRINMCRTKTSLLDLKIELRQKVKIVNFEPMDIVTLSNLIMETGRALSNQREFNKKCFVKAWYYRNWVKPLVSLGRDWTVKKAIDSRHVIGMEISEATKLYDFIQTCVWTLKEVPTANADNIREKLIAYNKLINDTIKLCQRAV